MEWSVCPANSRAERKGICEGDMKRLIAQRPIQYMGRIYERGEAIPANNPKMVAAWLSANSAAWAGTDLEDAARAAVQEAARRSKVNDLAAEAIRAMGVVIEDDAGEFVGVSSMEEQIRALFAPGRLQDGGETKEGQEPAGSGNHIQDGQETPGEDENGQDGGMPPIAGIWLSTGRFDAADLGKWKKADLEKLAADMGVDISKAKSNAERAAILAAVEIQASADASRNDGGVL